MANWYIKKGSKETGPHDGKYLHAAAKSGELKSVDLIRRDDMSKWVRAGKVKGLLFRDEQAQKGVEPDTSGQVQPVVKSASTKPDSALGSAVTKTTEGSTGEKKNSIVVISIATLAVLFSCCICGNILSFFDTDDEAEISDKPAEISDRDISRGKPWTPDELNPYAVNYVRQVVERDWKESDGGKRYNKDYPGENVARVVNGTIETEHLGQNIFCVILELDIENTISYRVMRTTPLGEYYYETSGPYTDSIGKQEVVRYVKYVGKDTISDRDTKWRFLNAEDIAAIDPNHEVIQPDPFGVHDLIKPKEGVISVEDLYRSFHKAEASADHAYIDRILTVYGYVHKVDSDHKGRPYVIVRMRTTSSLISEEGIDNIGYGVLCYLKNGEDLAKIKVQDRYEEATAVAFTGRCLGKMYKESDKQLIVIEDCQLNMPAYDRYVKVEYEMLKKRPVYAEFSAEELYALQANPSAASGSKYDDLNYKKIIVDGIVSGSGNSLDEQSSERKYTLILEAGTFAKTDVYLEFENDLAIKEARDKSTGQSVRVLGWVTSVGVKKIRLEDCVIFKDSDVPVPLVDE